MTNLVQTVWSSATKADLIGIVLLLYAGSILVFGLLYFRMYRMQPDLFFVQSDIQKMHAKRLLAGLTSRLAGLREEIGVLAEVETALASGSIGEIPGMLPSGRRLDGRGYTGMLPDGNHDDGVWLEVRELDGGFLARLDEYEYHELTPEFALQWIRRELTRRREDEKRADGRKARIKVSSQGSLGCGDLIYFSGVTQTTVGYGDILPNSTGVRMLVLMQILIGYGLLVGLLNLVLTDGA